jgi:uncharacterized protein DUF5906
MNMDFDDLKTMLAAAPTIAPRKPAPKPRPAASAIPLQSGADTLPMAPWRDSPAVRDAQALLLEGAEMNPNSMILARLGLRDGLTPEQIEAGLNALYDAAQDSSGRPERLEALREQLPGLVRRAVDECGQVEPYLSAAEDLAPTAEAVPLDQTEQMFATKAWCEGMQCAIDLRTGEMLNRVQFDMRYPQVGAPHTAKSAWMVWSAHGDKRKSLAGLTFRPGSERFYQEAHGRCFNTWSPIAALPNTPDDEAVAPFLKLAAFVIPDAGERKWALDWMAWVAQNQGLKPNFAFVLGSTEGGVGKGLLMRPLKAAIGEAYWQNHSVEDALAPFNKWLGHTKLLVIEEMEFNERRKTHNQMKPLIASPPETLSVRDLYKSARDVPNILAVWINTNEEAALALAKGDRRYMVCWNNGPALPTDFADFIADDWYANGGDRLAAAWLMARDVVGVNLRGRAPNTKAKEDMRKAGRNALAEWVEDGIEREEAPFGPPLVCIADIFAVVPPHVRRVCPTQARLISALRHAGARAVGPLMRMGQRTNYTKDDRMQLWSVRLHETWAKLDSDGDYSSLKEAFWRMHVASGGGRLYGAI